MKLNSLQDLFLHELQDIFDAERQLVKALPKMAKAADTEELRKGFEEHLEQTKHHVERLEQVFEMIGTKPRGSTCDAMKGLVSEGQDIIEADGEPEVTDAGLICAAQKVEHYEIASYGCLCTWAHQLGHQDAEKLLHETLEEEKRTDAKLTELAQKEVNAMAATNA